MRGRRMGVAGLVLLLAAGCSAPRPDATPSKPDPDPTIQVSISYCGQGWTHPHAGEQTLLIANTGDVSADADLIDVPAGAVHAEIEGLAPGVTRPMRVTLGSGTYAIRCHPADSDPSVGPSVHIPGSARGGPATEPVSYTDLYGPAIAYQKDVATGLKMLTAKTKTLAKEVDRGDLPAARAVWLPAHLAYERLGAAYGTFGDFDRAIDGRPAGLPRGVRDPGFSGFHRVEYGLWHGESATSLRSSADRLYKDVKALEADWPEEEVDPGDLPLRAHEIMENSLQFELSGHADEGSGTTLATVAANLDGTRETVDVLRDLLHPRYPGLAEVDSLLKQVQDLLEAQKHGDRWTPVERLDPAARESIDGKVGELLERLAPIATICFPRQTS